MAIWYLNSYENGKLNITIVYTILVMEERIQQIPVIKEKYNNYEEITSEQIREDKEFCYSLVNTDDYKSYYSDEYREIILDNFESLDTLNININKNYNWYDYLLNLVLECDCNFNPCKNSLLSKMCNGGDGENLEKTLDTIVLNLFELSRDIKNKNVIKNKDDLVDGEKTCDCICNMFKRKETEELDKDIKIKLIGKGAKGIVYKVSYKNNDTKNNVVLKLMKGIGLGKLRSYKTSNDKTVITTKGFLNQSLVGFALMKYMGQTGNIIKNYDYSYCMSKKLGMNLMEEANGDLSDLFLKDLSNDEIEDIFLQLMYCLLTMQDKCDFVHNDLKDKNIFYKEVDDSSDIFREYEINNKEIMYNSKSKYTILLGDFDRSICGFKFIDNNGDVDDEYRGDLYFAPQVSTQTGSLRHMIRKITMSYCSISGDVEIKKRQNRELPIELDREYVNVEKINDLYCQIRFGYLNSKTQWENMKSILKIGKSLDILTIMLSLLNIRKFREWFLNKYENFYKTMFFDEDIEKIKSIFEDNMVDEYGAKKKSKDNFEVGESKYSSMAKILELLKKEKIQIPLDSNMAMKKLLGFRENIVLNFTQYFRENQTNMLGSQIACLEKDIDRGLYYDDNGEKYSKAEDVVELLKKFDLEKPYNDKAKIVCSYLCQSAWVPYVKWFSDKFETEIIGPNYGNNIIVFRYINGNLSIIQLRNYVYYNREDRIENEIPPSAVYYSIKLNINLKIEETVKMENCTCTFYVQGNGEDGENKVKKHDGYLEKMCKNIKNNNETGLLNKIEKYFREKFGEKKII